MLLNYRVQSQTGTGTDSGMRSGAPDSPPGQVVAAFCGSRVPTTRLAGGADRAWAAGGLVLKPVDDVEEATWIADVLADLPEDGFRINRPVRSASGTWTVDGWAAWTLIEGQHETSGRWAEVIGVAERLNTALRGVRRPHFLGSRSHAWAVGDRVAWGEEPLVVLHEALRPRAERLAALVRPDRSRSQVIHGDLTANVLFAPDLAPGVIDFTPYWRPARFGPAIVAIDAVLWHGASAEVLEAVPSGGERTSLLARAALYRLITTDRLAVAGEAGRRGTSLGDAAADHDRVAGMLEATAG